MPTKKGVSCDLLVTFEASRDEAINLVKTLRQTPSVLDLSVIAEKDPEKEGRLLMNDMPLFKFNCLSPGTFYEKTLGNAKVSTLHIYFFHLWMFC